MHFQIAYDWLHTIFCDFNMYVLTHCLLIATVASVLSLNKVFIIIIIIIIIILLYYIIITIIIIIIIIIIICKQHGLES